jgi:undecaprenyl pyrophosphate phosphatase UppP
MKKILTKIVGLALIVIAVILIFFGNLFHKEIEAIAFAIAAVAVVLVGPIVFIIEYRKKIKRIDYLEQTLEDHNIPFDTDD